MKNKRMENHTALARNNKEVYHVTDSDVEVIGKKE